MPCKQGLSVQLFGPKLSKHPGRLFEQIRTATTVNVVLLVIVLRIIECKLLPWLVLWLVPWLKVEKRGGDQTFWYQINDYQ